METHFASPERATKSKLIDQRATLSQNLVIDGLLNTVGGLLAILNKHRQIISLNDSLLNKLEIENPLEALGLRPGEAMSCVHAKGLPAGCGTTKFCSTCGAAKAFVASLEQHKPVEEICVLKASKNGVETDVVLEIRSHPLKIESSVFLLVFMRDVTHEQQRAALERTFFHDVNNMLSGLVGASEILASVEGKSPLVDIVRRSSLRLQKTVEIQRFLLACETDSYSLVQNQVSVGNIRKDIISLFSNHPAKQNKRLKFSKDLDAFIIMTDISLFQRVLANMITNALEASSEGETVTVGVNLETTRIGFQVHNPQVIPDEVARRVFQRNFSTKGSSGRGIGTFSMKLFGEKILGGKVSFTSTPMEGTIFTFSLPI